MLARKIRTIKDVYLIDNKLLYHIWNKRSDKKYVQTTVCSKQTRLQILSVLHDTNFNGHGGVFKMYENVLNKIW